MLKTNQNTRKATPASFKPGQSGNPAGRPKAGMQSFKDRLAHWLETKSYKEIKELVDNEKKWDKLLSIDAMVVRRIHDACQKDKTHDFVAILDRLLGKPAITADLQVTHALASRLDDAEKLLASEIVTDASFEILSLEDNSAPLITTNAKGEDIL